MTSPTPLDDEQIDVVLPLRTRYAATLRVIAAALGADAGFSVDEIDDLRLGLNEVFALLADGEGSGRVRTTFRIGPGQVSARLAPEDGPVDVQPDDLALTILRSVVDEFSFGADGVLLVKRAVEHDGS